MSDDRVVLSVPTKGEYARTARLAAGELASRLGMSIDAVDDLKLAVEEAFVLASAGSELSEVTFTFSMSADAIEILIGPMPGDGCGSDDSAAGERYAGFILEAVCDSFEYVEVDGACHLRLVKRNA